jgi:hypothetical protein
LAQFHTRRAEVHIETDLSVPANLPTGKP